MQYFNLLHLGNGIITSLRPALFWALGSGLMRGPRGAAEQVSPANLPMFHWQSDVSMGPTVTSDGWDWRNPLEKQTLHTSGPHYWLSAYIYTLSYKGPGLFLICTCFSVCQRAHCTQSENLSTLSPFVTFQHTVIQNSFIIFSAWFAEACVNAAYSRSKFLLIHSGHLHSFPVRITAECAVWLNHLQ